MRAKMPISERMRFNIGAAITFEPLRQSHFD
jgi:hypothetical protein